MSEIHARARPAQDARLHPEAVEYGLGDHFSVSKVFNYNAFQKCRRDVGVPDPFRVDRDDRPGAAHAETGRLGPFYAGGAEQEAFALQEYGEPRVQGASAMVGRAESAGADQHVAGVGLHFWESRHGRNLLLRRDREREREVRKRAEFESEG
mgnify:CR=1 FL=1